MGNIEESHENIKDLLLQKNNLNKFIINRSKFTNKLFIDYFIKLLKLIPTKMIYKELSLIQILQIKLIINE